MSSQLAGETTAEQPDVAALYQRHRNFMYRVAVADLAGTGADPGEAVALVVNQLLSMHERGTLRGVENWEAYLVRAVRHAAARLAGRAAREHLVEDADLVYLADRTHAGHFAMPDDRINSHEDQPVESKISQLLRESPGLRAPQA